MNEFKWDNIVVRLVLIICITWSFSLAIWLIYDLTITDKAIRALELSDKLMDGIDIGKYRRK